MADLNHICQTVLRDVNESLGIAVVDLQSGMLLAVAHNVPYFTHSYLEAVAAAAVDMFRGKTITTVEKLLTAQRGKTVQHMVKEVQLSTDHTYHFMSIVQGKPNALLLLVTTRKVKLDAGWAAVHAAMPSLAPHCP